MHEVRKYEITHDRLYLLPIIWWKKKKECAFFECEFTQTQYTLAFFLTRVTEGSAIFLGVYRTAWRQPTFVRSGSWEAESIQGRYMHIMESDPFNNLENKKVFHLTVKL